MNFSKKNHELKKNNKNFVSKAKFTLIIALLITINAVAQQQGINYKALIKDASGNIITTLIEIQFNVLEVSPTGTVIFSRAQTVQPDANGLIILDIASGDNPPSIGDFTTIDWASDTHYLNVQIKTGATFIDMGTTQFMAVPYAKHATTATTALNAGATSINGLTDGKSDNDGTDNGSSLFIGLDAGLNDEGTDNQNVGIGYQALYENTTGTGNTANGYQALITNNTGLANTAIGASALRSNTGSANTAIGYYALYGNTTGDGNVALGSGAGLLETGSNKLYIANSGGTPLIYGEFDNQILILNAKTTVNESTASFSANAINGIKTHTGFTDAAGVYGENTVSDFYGIGVDGEGGWRGVQGRVTGTENGIYFGVYGSSSGTNTGINYGVYGRASNGNTNYAMYAAGNMTVTGTFSNPSDRKLKTNIKTMANVMPSILKLKPKTYKITTEFVKKMNMPTGLQNGFIAQELKEVFPELVSNNVHPGKTKNDEPIEYLGINYNGIIPVLVKAIQEQQETIESLQSKVSSQKEDYNALLKRIVQLENNN